MGKNLHPFAKGSATTAMIKDDLHYRVAKSALKKLQTTLAQHDESMFGQKNWATEAHKATIVGQIAELEASTKEYERPKSGYVQRN
jgi:hypothetical protein